MTGQVECKRVVKWCAIYQNNRLPHWHARHASSLGQADAVAFAPIRRQLLCFADNGSSRLGLEQELRRRNQIAQQPDSYNHPHLPAKRRQG